MAGVQSCQIYLVVEVGPSALEQLAAAFGAAPVASVLLTPTVSGSLDAGTVKELVAVTQRRNIAILIADDASLARAVRADGVHLSAKANLSEEFALAREVVGRGAIVGVDVGGSRHLAMELGEAGADYIGFSSDESLAEALAVEGEALDAELDLPTGRDALISWWSEIFEVPCVAFDVKDAAEATALAAHGADFVSIAVTGDLSPDDVREAVGSVASNLKA